jgi:hypothetical protein
MVFSARICLKIMFKCRDLRGSHLHRLNILIPTTPDAHKKFYHMPVFSIFRLTIDPASRISLFRLSQFRDTIVGKLYRLPNRHYAEAL